MAVTCLGLTSLCINKLVSSLGIVSASVVYLFIYFILL